MNEHKRILILYASQTGTAQYLSEQLYRTLEGYKVTLRLFSIDEYNHLNLPNENIVLFLTSTTGYLIDIYLGDGTNPTSMN